MRTEVAIRKKNGFVYLVIFAVTDGLPQEIGKVFAGTEKTMPRLTGKQLLKRVVAHGPFIHSPRGNLVTIPATAAEVILASRQTS